ncbi:hypothetical protein QQS21_004659 [Conoideocrella luteorostrata]|uniref:NADPH-dependent FMN reductase-like domain-containing protein n=1 Tax=Conoideocrella luteorostrata TaxID=1105319 RepID=A0AAJ0CTD3_9HYPO|nr:hypothetical protein QQS21_004659 [Conoideocrella luteorostrata]
MENKPASHAVAVVTCSTRTPRLNPYITQFVCKILHTFQSNTIISTIDLQEQALPLYDEPAVPSHLPPNSPTSHYTNEHTRRWSQTVRLYDAFIFVTPQYNWSIPASLKNALDYLFHEWNGKPVVIVTYGGRGGGKAADHLRQILTGLRMRIIPATLQLSLTSQSMEKWLNPADVGLQDRKRWQAEGVEEKLKEAFHELVAALDSENSTACPVLIEEVKLS